MIAMKLIASSWPWWLLPAFVVFQIFYFITYPVAVMPFRLTCHEDLWGNKPPYSCLSYYCPRVKGTAAEEWWPQCKDWRP